MNEDGHFRLRNDLTATEPHTHKRQRQRQRAYRLVLAIECQPNAMQQYTCTSSPGAKSVPRTEGLVFLRHFDALDSPPRGLKSSSSLSKYTSRPTLGHDEPLEKLRKARHFQAKKIKIKNISPPQAVRVEKKTRATSTYTDRGPLARSIKLACCSLGSGLVNSSAGDANADEATDE